MKLLAIDGNSILNRAFYGVRLLSNQNGMFTNAIFGFLNILLKLRRDYPTELVAVTFDMRAPTFRHLRYEGYKANRKGMPEELAMQVQPLKDILKYLGYPIIQMEGYEADDLLGTLSARCAQKGYDCVIATGDRDSLQLINDHVQVCLVKTKENLCCDREQILKDYGIEPIRIIDLKGLMGDSSDNIPGVKGIGEKTALSLLQNYHSLDEIYEQLDQLKITPRVKKLLENGKESAFLSKELATICLEAPISVELDDLTVGAPDKEKLTGILSQLEMYSFFDKLGLNEPEPEEEEPEPEVTVVLTENPKLEPLREKLNQLGRIDFVLTDRLYLCLGDETCVFDHEYGETVLKELVFSSPLPKRTYQAKQFYKMADQWGLSFDNLCFDAELAAYLLSVSSKGYPLEDLMRKYLPDTVYGTGNKNLTAETGFSLLCDELLHRVKEQNMEQLMEEVELPLCQVLASMEQVGFGIDMESVKQYGDQLLNQIAQLKEQLFLYAGHSFNPNSTKELGVILFEELGLPAKKKTKTGYSTNAEVLEGLLGKHPIIETLLAYRRLSKLHSTYIVGLQKVVGTDQRVHSTFNQTETRTGRISSTEPNVQNIPVRTEEGQEIRRFFIAPLGYVLVDADYSQIELRILAHIADDKDMQRAFQEGLDIHRMTASQVFKIPFDEVPNTMRSRAKAINFGIVYGIGAYSLSQDIHVPIGEAKSYIEEYLHTYHGVRNYMEQIVEDAKANGYVETLYHRRRELNDIYSSNKVVQALAKRIALNTPIQGTAADIIKIAMIRVYRRLREEKLNARLILQVHDELIVEAAEDQADIVAQILKEEMQNAAHLSVELIVDVHKGKNWLEAKG
ncbi:MAG: DNA polymerase I [Massiliimalia sp.]|jgi:DNA polymerase-1